MVKIFLFFLIIYTSQLKAEEIDSFVNEGKVMGINYLKAKWLALGDSDFDSFQAENLHTRANLNAKNADCVLSPIEIQSRDGRDFGEFKKWPDSRRHDYRGNFSLSGATIRRSLYEWQDIFEDVWFNDPVQLLREIRNKFVGNKSLGELLLGELKALRDSGELKTTSVVVQITLGINDINGRFSLYNKFTSMKSHYPWINTKVKFIEKFVDKILIIHPNTIIVLWELHDDGGVMTELTIEQEKRITSHTQYWNDNLNEIALARPSVVVFKANELTTEWIGRVSNSTDKQIFLEGINYIREQVPREAVNNTRYIITMDGHANTVLSALLTRELYRLLNDRFGMGLQPFSPSEINSITCQKVILTDKNSSLDIPNDASINISDLPYSIGYIQANDSNGKDISDSAVATSDLDGVLYGDGQNIQLRSPRHGRGDHNITIKVKDANGRMFSRIMKLTVK